MKTTALLPMSVLLVLAPAGTASAHGDDESCDTICDRLAACELEDILEDGRPGAAGGATEGDAGEADDDHDPGGADTDDGEGEGEGDAEGGGGTDLGAEFEEEARADCMASCAGLSEDVDAVGALQLDAAAACVAEGTGCGDMDDDCLGRLEVPSCVAACEKIVDCGIFNPCDGDSGTSEGQAQPAPGDSGPGEDGGEAPEEREFHVECDADGNFDADAAKAECAADCAEFAFAAYDELVAFTACLGAAACESLEAECAPEMAAMDEATDGGEARGGGVGGGGDVAAGADSGEGEAELGAGGDAAGAGGPAAGGGGSKEDDGFCATSPAVGAASSGIPGVARAFILRR